MTDRQLPAAYGGSPPESYERFFVPAIGAPLATYLLRAAAIQPGERVLDVACGTGILARLAAREVGDLGSVAGLDLNPGMLAVARSTTAPETSIEWYEASAEAMPLEDESFDVVTCQMGIQFIAKRVDALREMRRVLARGGRLALNVPGPTPPLFVVLSEALASHVGPEAARFVDQVFSLHDSAQLEKLLGAAGFEAVTVTSDTRSLRLPAPVEFLWQYVHSTPLSGIVGQTDPARCASLEREVITKWQGFVDDDALRLEVRVVVATARK